MVYYFTSSVTEPSATLYVGKDKTENEELIKYGWEEDFHVDNLSSAHIYLRLAEGQEWDKLPKELVEECVQLTKANSIEGNKRENVTVIYTPWSNLKKDGGMAVGQVGFHDQKKTRRILVPTRTNAIINRLMKTRTEVPPPESSSYLRSERDAHMTQKRKVANEVLRGKKKEEERIMRERREEKRGRDEAWDDLVGEDRIHTEGRSNEDGFDEDDFM